MDIFGICFIGLLLTLGFGYLATRPTAPPGCQDKTTTQRAANDTEP